MIEIKSVAGSIERDLYAWSELKEQRGWTDGLIKKHLGEPDELRSNPHYKSGPQMRLFRLARVEEVEAMPDVATDLAKAKARRPARSEAALAAADARRSELLAAVESIEINVPRFNFDHVTRAAVNSYNCLWSARGKVHKHATMDDDPEFLKRITCNFIRHNLVNYDAIVAALGGRVGKKEAYWTFRIRIMEGIYAVYPELA